MACGYKYISRDNTNIKDYLYVELQLTEHFLTHKEALNGQLEHFTHLTSYMKTVLNMVIANQINKGMQQNNKGILDLMQANNILQPYDILGGHTVCDFLLGKPDKIMKLLIDLQDSTIIKAKSKKTLLRDFLEV